MCYHICYLLAVFLFAQFRTDINAINKKVVQLSGYFFRHDLSSRFISAVVTMCAKHFFFFLKHKHMCVSCISSPPIHLLSTDFLTFGEVIACLMS